MMRWSLLLLVIVFNLLIVRVWLSKEVDLWIREYMDFLISRLIGVILMTPECTS
jgi:hypothetical protein